MSVHHHASRATLEQARSLIQAGRYREAIGLAEQTAERHGDSAASDYLRIVGHMCVGANKLAGEIAARAVQEHPRHASLLAAAGAALIRNGDGDGAQALLERAVGIEPSHADAWIQLTTLHLTRKAYAAAADTCERAMALAPRDVTALTHHAALLKVAGDPAAAIRIMREVIAISPDFYTHRSNLLFFLLFDEEASPLELRQEAEACGRVLAATPAPADTPDAERRPSPPHKLRLGVLSADLRQHACAYFLIPLLAHLDRNRVEVVCLSLHPGEDAVTDRIRQLSDRFVSVAGLGSDDVIAAVRAEQIDALIDLGGHTENTPLQYMAHGLAPLQLTWLGYPGTTGVSAVGLRISDAMADPDGSEVFYTETLLRAPGVFCPYAPLVQAPLRAYEPAYRVAPTPALRNGFITFGSCNNLNKVTPGTLRLWSAVLARCPGSRLLVEAADVDQPAVRKPLLARMTLAGIDIQRVTLVPRATRNQYLTYHDIDIVLDTYPLTGGTTTCDALWMGVPVVTLTGAGFHSRMSATFLHASGLESLACRDALSYVEAAAALASDPAGLDRLRQGIRQRFESAAVDYAPAFAAWLEDELLARLPTVRAADVPARQPADEQLFFGGRNYTLREIYASVGVLLERQDEAGLKLMLEYVASKWPRHWVIAYALAMQAHAGGDLDGAVALLMEAIAMHPQHLPLYALLTAWMQTGGYDMEMLAGFLQEQFGLTPMQLAQDSAPSVARVLGFA
jgi:predicted O-linked N-acetylglucosamine transferase (SPINDLY family)